MREYYFDLRSGDLKIIVIDNKDIIYSTYLENIFLQDREEIKKIFKEIRENTGHYPSLINLILPDEEFTLMEVLIPKISDEDTIKLIRKRLESELNTKDLSFYHSFLREEENGRLFLVQAIKADRLKYYESLFKSFKTKICRVVSGLVLNFAITERLTLKEEKPKIIVEIEKGSIYIFLASKGNILKYQQFSIPKINLDEKTDLEITKDRLIKKQIYLITDYLYNFNLNVNQEMPESIADSFIIYGSALYVYEGLDLAFYDALNQNIQIYQEKIGLEKSLGIYITLYLYSEFNKEEFFNFIIKRQYKDILINVLESKAVAYTLIICFVLLVAFFEYQNFLYKRELSNKKNELEAFNSKLKIIDEEKETLIRIKQGRVPMYNVLKELGNSLPDNIFLEKLVYTRSEAQKKNLLELTYNIPWGKDLSDKRVITHIRDIFNRLSGIKVYGEPSLSNKTIEKKNYLVIKINYELEGYVK
ncbi:MAG: hypothetical protein N2202_04345 [Proteobacteria bacterium]|nr:hypothetical protein [Pseudomonadota bacterium]